MEAGFFIVAESDTPAHPIGPGVAVGNTPTHPDAMAAAAVGGAPANQIWRGA